MAHPRKDNVDFKLRLGRGLRDRLDAAARKLQTPSSNQLAVDLIQAGLMMIDQPGDSCSVDGIIKEFRLRMGKGSDAALVKDDAESHRVREIVREELALRENPARYGATRKKR